MLTRLQARRNESPSAVGVAVTAVPTSGTVLPEEPSTVTEAPALVQDAALEDDEGGASHEAVESPTHGPPGDDGGGEWQEVSRRRGGSQAARVSCRRPKFKLGNTAGYDNAYQAVVALQRDLPNLLLDIRPNLKGEYVLTPKDDASAARMLAVAQEEGPAARLVLLDPAERRVKRVLQRYPLDMPLEAVLDHRDVVSAVRLRATDRALTRQVMVELTGEAAAADKLDLGVWGRYSLRMYDKEPLRCYKCQRYNHLQGRCQHAVKCGVCSQGHATEVCIRRHKAQQTTAARCPNCAGRHHAWHPRCPERLRRLPNGGRRQQDGLLQDGGGWGMKLPNRHQANG